ncbi:MAG: cytochrome c oxidase assembly factor Coa1 family protein [Phycisphaeraceae bacterium]
MTSDADDQPDKLPLLPKRKKFLVPVIILLGFTLVGSVAGLIIGFTSIKRSDAFKATIDELNQHPAVKQHVGQPFEAGWLVLGKHDERNGTYDLTFRIEGSVGEAAVRCRCERDRDDAPWQVTYLDIGVGGRGGDVYTLVGDPDMPPGGAVE